MLGHRQVRDRLTSMYVGRESRFEDVADKIRHGGVCPASASRRARPSEALFRFMFVVLNAGLRQTKNDSVGYRRDEQVRHGVSYQGALNLFNHSRRHGTCDATGKP